MWRIFNRLFNWEYVYIENTAASYVKRPPAPRPPPPVSMNIKGPPNPQPKPRPLTEGKWQHGRKPYSSHPGYFNPLPAIFAVGLIIGVFIGGLI